MKQRMDERRPGGDGAHIAGAAKRRTQHGHLTEAQISVQVTGRAKRELRFDTAALQHLERSRESVIVYRGGAVDPEKNVDVESPAPEQGHGRLTEVGTGIGLMRQL